MCARKPDTTLQRPMLPRRQAKIKKLQKMYRKSIFILLICVCSAAVLAQDKPAPQKDDKGYTLSVETLEVNLPISVLDKDGRPVDGLKKEHFQIYEDKIQQTIKTFRHEDIPLSL